MKQILVSRIIIIHANIINMCGIIGFHLSHPEKYSHHKEVFEILLKSAQSRGKEASGIAVSDEDGRSFLIKSDLDSRKLIKTPEYEHFTKKIENLHVSTIIGHSRLATHGSQLLHEHNQPVVSNDKTLLMVHNGIITNQKEIWRKINNNLSQPELDSQILLEYFRHLLKTNCQTDALIKLYNDIEGTASIAISIPSQKKLILASNTGSLYWVHNKNESRVIFASEKIFLKDSDIIMNSYQSKEINHLAAGTGVIISKEEIKKISFSKKNKRNRNFSEKINTTKIVDLSTKKLRSIAATHYTNKQNNISILKKHDFDYQKISKIRRCSRCILPETTPFISFDKNNVCNFCREHKPIIHLGIKKLKQELKKYKKNDGSPDCLVAFSGGRDSSYGLHFLKNELGLQPLAYTYDWGMVTDLARRNQARILSKLGIEHIVISADVTLKRKHIKENILAWLKNPHLGMVPLFMEGDKQCEYYADQLMKKYDIDLMFFFRGNELEKEEFKTGHCGVKDADPGGVIHNLEISKKIKLFSFYVSQYLRNPSYFNSSFFDTSLAFFSTYIQNHDYFFLWHYIPWNEKEIIHTLTSKYNWELPTETTATWRTDDGTSAFYNYIYYQVQGFTENDSFRSRQVREGIMTRAEALKKVNQENKPRYESLKWYFDMVGLNGDEVLSAVDKIPKLY